MSREIHHFATDTPHRAACGAMAAPHRNGHALTSRAYAVNCPECLRLGPPARTYPTNILQPTQSPPNPHAKRDAQIIAWRQEGARYWQIADRIGLSAERVRQICLRGEATP